MVSTSYKTEALRREATQLTSDTSDTGSLGAFQEHSIRTVEWASTQPNNKGPILVTRDQKNIGRESLVGSGCNSSLHCHGGSGSELAALHLRDHCLLKFAAVQRTLRCLGCSVQTRWSSLGSLSLDVQLERLGRSLKWA